MPEKSTGYLIRFDEERRNFFLREVRDLAEGFSDALSSVDWPIRQWEVCGLLFAPGRINYWALARKGKRVATGKVRVEFIEVVPTDIGIADIVQRVGKSVQKNIVSTRSGSGGALPASTWQSLKRAVGEISPESLQIIERLERLRDQSRDRISRPGAEIVAQQRDAVGLMLDVFDQTGDLRKSVLHSWSAPDAGLTSFLDGINGVRTIEDQLIARDAAVFPDTEAVRTTILGSVFSSGGRRLEVFNINRGSIEKSLGVDLIYFHDEFDAWTMVQYKSMGYSDEKRERSAVYRPNEQFDDQMAQMITFREEFVDKWRFGDGRAAYRLSGDGFFFKFCSRVQLEVLSEALLPGMYLSREHVQAILADPSTLGSRGGRQITFENAGRHISNTLFADLLRDGWIGTRTIASTQIAAIVRACLGEGRAVVIGRARREGESANEEQTLAAIGLL